eukprot:3689925-Rhodomonas_salina.3
MLRASASTLSARDGALGGGRLDLLFRAPRLCGLAQNGATRDSGGELEGRRLRAVRLGGGSEDQRGRKLAGHRNSV